MRSLLELRPACRTEGVELQFDLGGGEALVGRARAGSLAKFLASAATHMIFIDADIGFEPASVFRLLRSGYDVAGGVYRRKSQPGFEVGEPLGAATPDGFQPVTFVGAGFLFLNRSAAQRITDAYPALRAGLGDVRGAQISTATMVFDSFAEPETGRYLADHQAFCRRWRDIGGVIWADMRSCLVHVGEIEHSGPPPAFASIASQP